MILEVVLPMSVRKISVATDAQQHLGRTKRSPRLSHAIQKTGRWFLRMASDLGSRLTGSACAARYRRRTLCCALTSGLVVLSSVAVAKGANDSPTKTLKPTHDLSFHAGRVSIERPLSTLALCDSVEVAVHRYRLTADRLTLQRTLGGVLVRGPGMVSFCPCASTPITVAFTETTVAPPTDLLIRNAVVRANGIPIFYAPVLWLRSPNRFGVLSPHFGWRASEGAWIGTGLHMPLRGSEQSSLSVVDVNVGSYLRGGLDLGGQLTTPRSTTQLRWDRLDTSFVEVNSLFVEQASLHERLAYTQARSERVRAGLAVVNSGHLCRW